jgi:hypothetical protein
VSCEFRQVANCVAVINGLFWFGPVIRPAYGQNVLVRVEDRTRVTPTNRVVAREPSTGLDREIYRSEGDIFGHVVLSPSGPYVAFIEVVGPGGGRTQRLVVLEVSTGTIRRYGESSIYALRGIREYLWCCGPDTLAIITGQLSDEGGTGKSTTLPHGLSLVDVRTGGAMPIKGLRFPLQIHWAAFDSSLYIKDSPDAAPGARGPTVYPVYRYDVLTRALSRTAHRGIFFSPDGKYYFDTGFAEASGSFALYQTATDRDVTAQLAVPRHHLGPEGGWMPGADHVLLFIEKAAPKAPKPTQPGDSTVRLSGPPRPRVFPDRWNLAVDAETGRVIDRFQGDLGAGWKTNAPALPIERRTGIDLLPARRP